MSAAAFGYRIASSSYASEGEDGGTRFRRSGNSFGQLMDILSAHHRGGGVGGVVSEAECVINGEEGERRGRGMSTATTSSSAPLALVSGWGHTRSEGGVSALFASSNGNGLISTTSIGLRKPSGRASSNAGLLWPSDARTRSAAEAEDVPEGSAGVGVGETTVSGFSALSGPSAAGSPQAAAMAAAMAASSSSFGHDVSLDSLLAELCRRYAEDLFQILSHFSPLNSSGGSERLYSQSSDTASGGGGPSVGAQAERRREEEDERGERGNAPGPLPDTSSSRLEGEEILTPATWCHRDAATGNPDRGNTDPAGESCRLESSDRDPGRRDFLSLSREERTRISSGNAAASTVTSLVDLSSPPPPPLPPFPSSSPLTPTPAANDSYQRTRTGTDRQLASVAEMIERHTRARFSAREVILQYIEDALYVAEVLTRRSSPSYGSPSSNTSTPSHPAPSSTLQLLPPLAPPARVNTSAAHSSSPLTSSTPSLSSLLASPSPQPSSPSSSSRSSSPPPSPAERRSSARGRLRDGDALAARTAAVTDRGEYVGSAEGRGGAAVASAGESESVTEFYGERSGRTLVGSFRRVVSSQDRWAAASSPSAAGVSVTEEDEGPTDGTRGGDEVAGSVENSSVQDEALLQVGETERDVANIDGNEADRSATDIGTGVARNSALSRNMVEGGEEEAVVEEEDGPQEEEAACVDAAGGRRRRRSGSSGRTNSGTSGLTDNGVSDRAGVTQAPLCPVCLESVFIETVGGDSGTVGIGQGEDDRTGNTGRRSSGNAASAGSSSSSPSGKRELDVAILRCGHRMHLSCILEYYFVESRTSVQPELYRQRCPICRGEPAGRFKRVVRRLSHRLAVAQSLVAASSAPTLVDESTSSSPSLAIGTTSPTPSSPPPPPAAPPPLPPPPPPASATTSASSSSLFVPIARASFNHHSQANGYDNHHSSTPSLVAHRRHQPDDSTHTQAISHHRHDRNGIPQQQQNHVSGFSSILPRIRDLSHRGNITLSQHQGTGGGTSRLVSGSGMNRSSVSHQRQEQTQQQQQQASSWTMNQNRASVTDCPLSLNSGSGSRSGSASGHGSGLAAAAASSQATEPDVRDIIRLLSSARRSSSQLQSLLEGGAGGGGSGGGGGEGVNNVLPAAFGLVQSMSSAIGEVNGVAGSSAPTQLSGNPTYLQVWNEAPHPVEVPRGRNLQDGSCRGVEEPASSEFSPDLFRRAFTISMNRSSSQMRASVRTGDFPQHAHADPGFGAMAPQEQGGPVRQVVETSQVIGNRTAGSQNIRSRHHHLRTVVTSLPPTMYVNPVAVYAESGGIPELPVGSDRLSILSSTTREASEGRSGPAFAPVAEPCPTSVAAPSLGQGLSTGSSGRDGISRQQEREQHVTVPRLSSMAGEEHGGENVATGTHSVSLLSLTRNRALGHAGNETGPLSSTSLSTQRMLSSATHSSTGQTLEVPWHAGHVLIPSARYPVTANLASSEVNHGSDTVIRSSSEQESRPMSERRGSSIRYGNQSQACPPAPGRNLASASRGRRGNSQFQTGGTHGHAVGAHCSRPPVNRDTWESNWPTDSNCRTAGAGGVGGRRISVGGQTQREASRAGTGRRASDGLLRGCSTSRSYRPIAHPPWR